MDRELETSVKTVLRALTAYPAPKTSYLDKLIAVINAPIVIAIFSGGILAWISSALTDHYAQRSKMNDIALSELHRKQDFFDSFASKIELYLAITLSMRQREIWLKLAGANPGRDSFRYPDGRTFEQTRDEYEKEKQFWFEHAPDNPVALTSTAKSVFKKPDTQTRLEDVEKTLETYERANSEPGLRLAYEEAFKILESAENSMAKDLHEEKSAR